MASKLIKSVPRVRCGVHPHTWLAKFFCYMIHSILNTRFVRSIALVLGLLLVYSCSNPKDTFTKALLSAAQDKAISQTEMENLDRLLSNALLKNKQGFKIGTKDIKGHDDMVAYLAAVKHCDPIYGVMPEKNVGFKNFNIIMENSKSMSGYIGKGNPNFAEPIIALFQCGNDTTVFNPKYASADGDTDEVQFKEATQETFLTSITSGKFVTGVASPIDRILSSAVDEITENYENVVEDVFCLITDGIMSGTNAEIVSDRDFTKKHLPVLENRIRTAVSKAQKLGLDCLVYRLETPFSGTYYDYKNGHHALNDIRPYFMILFGDRVNLESIEAALAKESNFTSKSSSRFASYEVASLKTIKRATLRRLPGQNGVTKGAIVEYTPDNTPVAFNIQLNLNSLPSYFLNDKALRKELQLTYTDKTSGTEVSIPNEDWLDNITFDSDTKIFDLTVLIDPDYLKKMTLEGPMHLSLAGHQDNWYKTMSCDDDTSIVPGDVTTFALDRFMGGIMKGFGYDDTESLPDAIDYKFNIKKSK